MIRRPPRSTRVRSSAASDVYKRQGFLPPEEIPFLVSITKPFFIRVLTWLDTVPALHPVISTSSIRETGPCLRIVLKILLKFHFLITIEFPKIALLLFIVLN